MSVILASLFVARLSAQMIPMADNIERDKGVMVVTNENYEAVLSNSPILMIYFYDQKCSECYKMDIEFATAAWMMRETRTEIKKPEFAKVDVTLPSQLAIKHNVKKFPTIIFIKNDKPKTFSGGPNADSIYQWVKRKSGDPAKLLLTLQDFNNFVNQSNVVVIGLFNDLDIPEAEVFTEFAEDNMLHSFGITKSTEIFQLLRVNENSAVVILKNFDEGFNILTGEQITTEALQSFISRNSEPLIINFNIENAKAIFQVFEKSACVLLFTRDDVEITEEIRNVATDARGKFRFVSVNMNLDENLRLLDFLGITNREFPTFLLTKFEADLVKLRPENEILNDINIKQSIEYFKLGLLKPHLNKQKLPDDWNSRPVAILVADNFHSVTEDPAVSVFVKFYTTWCSHCKAVENIWEELGENFSQREDVIIAQIDMTANHMENVKVLGYPSFRLYKSAGQARQEIDFTGQRDLENFIKFVKTENEPERKEEL